MCLPENTVLHVAHKAEPVKSLHVLCKVSCSIVCDIYSYIEQCTSECGHEGETLPQLPELFTHPVSTLLDVQSNRLHLHHSSTHLLVLREFSSIFMWTIILQCIVNTFKEMLGMNIIL